MKQISLILLGLLIYLQSFAAVVLPYTYGTNVPPSQANANDQSLRDEINSHEALPNGHNTTLSSVLAVGASVGAYSINFNGKELFNALVEKVTVDPSCSGTATVKGRLIFNTSEGLLKFCDGSSFVSIAGTGVNTLASVLSAGNSAGSTDLNMNERQLKAARVENLSSDPSPGNIGRLFYNTVDSAFRIDDGSSIVTLGGSQGLSSVLGVSNSAGSTNLDMNGNQILNFKVQSLSSDPTGASGRVYYNSSTHKLKFYNGTSWLEIGNTNTLAQTMALGNSVGSNDLDLNGHELLNAKLENLDGPPGTADPGRIWYDTDSDQVQFETAGSDNRTVCTLDDDQTITNKTISGSSNTFTNIPDSALSANQCKLDSSQSFTGTKTFTAYPIMSSIKTPSGAVHAITDGLSNDTFTLNKAVQELEGKTLKSPTLSGSLDFNHFQAVKMRLENLSSTPLSGHAGRIIYKTSTGEVQYDTGFNWITFQTNLPNTGWSTGGNAGLDDTLNFIGTSDAEDLVFKTNDTEAFRIDAAGTLKTQLGTGLVKSIAGDLGLAVSETDYAPPTSGTAIQKGNGVGGFSDATAGTDYAPPTSGTAIQKGDGSGGFSGAVSGTDYAPATSGTSIQKGNGTGGFSSAVSGTDYAPATSGSSIQKGNGSGGFSSAVAGTDYEVPVTFSGGVTRIVNAVTCDTASGSTKGCLGTSDFNNFDAKVGSFGSFGSSPHANGATVSGGVATLQPADATHPGGLSISSQDIAGEKRLVEAIGMKQVSTPSNPSSGYNKVYFKSDEKLYKLTSAGIELEVGSGGGTAMAVLTKTTGYSILNGDFTGTRLLFKCNCTDVCTMVLPSSASNAGYEVHAINVGSATCNIDTDGTDTYGSNPTDKRLILPAGGSPQSGNILNADGGTQWEIF